MWNIFQAWIYNAIVFNKYLIKAYIMANRKKIMLKWKCIDNASAKEMDGRLWYLDDWRLPLIFLVTP